LGYRFLADAVALLHLCFVLFIPLGGIAVLWRPRLAWLHLACTFWGALIVWTHVVCPLTPLEKALRVRAGGGAYEGGFIRHYLVGPVFSGAMPSPVAWTLLCLALLLNGWLYRRAALRPRASRTGP
jgi:hypothetical protein